MDDLWKFVLREKKSNLFDYFLFFHSFEGLVTRVFFCFNKNYPTFSYQSKIKSIYFAAILIQCTCKLQLDSLIISAKFH